MILTYRNLFKSLIVSVFLVNLVASTAESVLSEEGCRYHGTLKATISYKNQKIEYDFMDEHVAMASVINSDADELQYSSLVRFHPVSINSKGQLEIGRAVHLTSPDLLSLSAAHPTYEVGFASGEYNAKSQDPSMKYSSSYDLALDETTSKHGLFTLRTALHKTKKEGCVANKFPIRFMMYNYVDPGLLKRQLNHRYVEIEGSIMTRGENVAAITTPHLDTISTINGSRKRARETLLKMAELVKEDATAIVLEQYQSSLEATQTPNSNPKTNSYNCAEQCQFTYLRDQRIIKYLQERLNVDSPNFVGMIVSAHCSHTPCHSCSTSFTREMESGGVFNKIVKDKSAHVLCSCQWHYSRPKEMLRYDQTFFFENLRDDSKLLASHKVILDPGSIRIPYPVVLLESNPDGKWKVGFEHYQKIISK